MWEIAGLYADYSIITDDETYWEDSMEIINDIEKWIKETNGEYIVMQDRKEAIKFAIQNARQWDIVIITGLWAFESRNIWWKESEWSDLEIVKEFVNLETR